MRKILIVILAWTMLFLVACSKSSNQADGSGNNPDATANDSSDRSSRSSHESEAERHLIVPADTNLAVKLNESLSTKTATAGQAFSATLAAPVEVGGKTAIPEGAPVQGTVVESGQAGRFKGAGGIAIRLSSITIHGKEHAIETTEVVATVKGKGKRTAVVIGGGAGLGALIGGLVGGGKGAAIGAVSGAGAGTAGAALTGKRDVTLPAESTHYFKLKQPLEIK